MPKFLRVSCLIMTGLGLAVLLPISLAQRAPTSADTFVSSGTPSTSVPNLIRYSGVLKSTQAATPLSLSTSDVTFAIYAERNGGSPLWQPIHGRH